MITQAITEKYPKIIEKDDGTVLYRQAIAVNIDRHPGTGSYIPADQRLYVYTERRDVDLNDILVFIYIKYIADHDPDEQEIADFDNGNYQSSWFLNDDLETII